MASRKGRLFLLALVIALATVLISQGTLRMMSPALALERAGTELVRLDPPAQPKEALYFIAFFTADLTIQILDLSGKIIGEGEHGGEVKCNRNNCNQATRLQLNDIEYKYKFTTRQALDPVAQRAVVEGMGTISSPGQKERFSFTATFQDNRDGTVLIRYGASRSDASFILPRAPGRLEFRAR
jgi:hypothetical protein